jgi:hypothetical protein
MSTNNEALYYDPLVSQMKEMLKVADKVKSRHVNVELECRIVIPDRLVPKNLQFKDLTIQYYKSWRYQTLTIRSLPGEKCRNLRSSNNNHKCKDVCKCLDFETKETIKRKNFNFISIVCSVEKRKQKIEFPIYKHITRKIKRANIDNNVVITNEEGIYTLEVEYNKQNLQEYATLLKQYIIPYWPCAKPCDAYSSEILSRINEGWHISSKLDGIHIMLYDKVLIDDTGFTHNLEKQFNFQTPFPSADRNLFSNSSNIYEGEKINDNIVLFDTYRFNGIDVSNLTYEERLKFIPEELRKKVYSFKTYTEFCEAYDRCTNITDVSFPTDGYILTNNYKLNSLTSVYKSKAIPTVDLQYINGFLHLAGETHSSRIPLNHNNFVFEEGKIYEFDLKLKLIKVRKDKIYPNVRMPVEIDPLSNIRNVYGVPCLRYHHNAVKMKLLSLLDKNNLLDIGSGFTRDIQKWYELEFEHVLAVDPNGEFSNKIFNTEKRKTQITFIKDKIENLTLADELESISIFFVPWSNTFLDIMRRANKIALIIMDKPENASNEYYNVKVESNKSKVKLSIYNTMTGKDIDEEIPNTEKIDKYMFENGFKKENVELEMKFGHEFEIKLSKMYSYIYYEKAKEDHME